MCVVRSVCVARSVSVCVCASHPYLVVELVVEEVLPQGVGQVEDGGDDDAVGGEGRET